MSQSPRQHLRSLTCRITKIEGHKSISTGHCGLMSNRNGIHKSAAFEADGHGNPEWRIFALNFRTTPYADILPKPVTMPSAFSAWPTAGTQFDDHKCRQRHFPMDVSHDGKIVFESAREPDAALRAPAITASTLRRGQSVHRLRFSHAVRPRHFGGSLRPAAT